MANKHQAQQSGVRVLKGNSSESSQEDPDRDFDAHWSQGCIDPDELFSRGVSGTKTAPSGSRSPIPCSEVGISQRARPAAELAQPEAAQPEPICAEERAPDPAQDAKLHSHCRLSTIIIGPTDPWASPSGARQGGQCQLPPQMIMPMSAMDHADDVVGDSVLDGILDVLAAPAQPASTEGEEDAIATGEAESPAHECEEAEGKKSKGREFQEVDGKESVGQGFKEAEGKESEGEEPPAALGDAKTLAAEDSEASNSEVNEGTDEEGRVAAEDTVSASLLHQEDSPGLVDDDSCEALEDQTNALQSRSQHKRGDASSGVPVLPITHPLPHHHRVMHHSISTRSSRHQPPQQMRRSRSQVVRSWKETCIGVHAEATAARARRAVMKAAAVRRAQAARAAAQTAAAVVTAAMALAQSSVPELIRSQLWDQCPGCHHCQNVWMAWSGGWNGCGMPWWTSAPGFPKSLQLSIPPSTCVLELART